jgi:hypothetical protein
MLFFFVNTSLSTFLEGFHDQYSRMVVFLVEAGGVLCFLGHCRLRNAKYSLLLSKLEPVIFWQLVESTPKT